RQSAARKYCFALNHFSGFLCSMTCSGSEYNFIYDLSSYIRIFFQVKFKIFTYSSGHDARNLCISQFALRLSLKLRLLYFYRDNRCEAFTEVISGYTDLRLGKQAVVITILLKHPIDSTSESCNMSSSLPGINVV